MKFLNIGLIVCVTLISNAPEAKQAKQVCLPRVPKRHVQSKFSKLTILSCLPFSYYALLGPSCDYEEAKAVAELCKEEVGATDDDVETILKFEPAGTMEAKCLHACIIKRFGVMNGDGKIDRDKAMEILTIIASGNGEQQALGVEVLEACADIDVNEDHCEAAEEYRTCMHAKAKENGFIMGRV